MLRSIFRGTLIALEIYWSGRNSGKHLLLIINSLSNRQTMQKEFDAFVVEFYFEEI